MHWSTSHIQTEKLLKVFYPNLNEASSSIFNVREEGRERRCSTLFTHYMHDIPSSCKVYGPKIHSTSPSLPFDGSPDGIQLTGGTVRPFNGSIVVIEFARLDLNAIKLDSDICSLAENCLLLTSNAVLWTHPQV